MYFEIGESGKIMVCCDEQISPGMINLTPPDEFSLENMHDWKVVDGEFIYDPVPLPEVPTLGERITALEEENDHLKEALELLLSGATEEVTDNG